MGKIQKVSITVEVTVAASANITWEAWTAPQDILKWNFASADWQTTYAENDLKPGGRFLSRMEAKDGSIGFDFYGFYDNIIPEKLIEYTLGDDRKVKVTFYENEAGTKLVQTFEAESENPIELQQAGWQAILDNFKNYVEANQMEWPYNC